jgi:hypothetical protein
MVHSRKLDAVSHSSTSAASKLHTPFTSNDIVQLEIVKGCVHLQRVHAFHDSGRGNKSRIYFVNASITSDH